MSTAAIQGQPLHPYIQYDPAASKTTNVRWERLWKVAAVVTAVAMIALAATAFVLTSLWYPAQVPLATLLILLTQGSSFAVVNKPLTWSKEYAQNAALDGAILQEYEKLKDKDLNAELAGLQINPGIEAEKLKSVLARYLYQMAQFNEHSKLAEKALSCREVEVLVGGETKKITPDDFSVEKTDFSNPEKAATFDALQQLRKNGKDHLQEAALHKLEAAYLLHIMQNPQETKDLNDLVDVLHIPDTHRRYAKKGGDDSYKMFARAGEKTFTIKAVIDQNVTQFSTALFAK